MVDVIKPQQQGSIGRRLIGMAAPIAGAALGGPAGAAIGGMIGSKLNGGSTQDALLNAGASYASTPRGAGPADGSIVGQGAGGAFSRKMGALSQDPQVAIQDGLNAATLLPPDIRKQVTPTLVQAQFASRGQKLPGI